MMRAIGACAISRVWWMKDLRPMRNLARVLVPTWLWEL